MTTTSGFHSDPTRSGVASLSAKEYVEKFKLDMYMKDVVRLVLGRRDEWPIRTVYTYYKNVCAGEHVAVREYEYIFATQRNRLAFIRFFEKCFPHLSASETMTTTDYHQLLCCLCEDFPVSIVNEATVGGQEKDMNYGSLSATVQVYFFYKEFFDELRNLFNSLAGATRANPTKETTVCVGDFVTLVRMACYGKDDSTSSSAIVLALGESKSRGGKHSSAYPPCEVVCAGLFQFCLPSQVLMGTDGKTSPEGHKTTVDFEVDVWDRSAMTWGEALRSIVGQEVLVTPLRGFTLPQLSTNLVDAGIFPTKKDEKRSALAKTLLQQLANEPSSPSRVAEVTRAPSSSSQSDGKRRRKKSGKRQ